MTGDAARGSPPDFVVAGAGRAGTTALIEGLRRHPGVFVTDPKEPHYLAMHGTEPDFRGPGDDRHVNRQAVTRAEDYLALYAGGDGLLRGEGSVSTMYYHDRSIPELLRLNPDVRVVVLLREPVARAFSSFQYLRNSGREPLADLRAAVAVEPSRRAANWHHLWHYTAMSRYADSLAALRAALGPDRVGIWFYDDLEREYEATVRAVLDFLGAPEAPWEPAAVPRVNASGTPRLAWTQDALARASATPAVRHAVRRLTTWRFREAVRTRLLRRSEVSAEVRRELAPLFADDLREVRAQLDEGRPLPPWLTGPGGASRVRAEGPDVIDCRDAARRPAS